MRKSNKGFSLVELLVIIAIIAVLTTSATALFVNWREWNLSDCARKIDTMLSAAKVDVMSREAGETVIWRESDGIYYMKVVGEEQEALGDDKIEIYYHYKSNDAVPTDVRVKVEGPTVLELSYNRDTGAFKPIGQDGGGKNIYCSEIEIVRLNRMQTIRLERNTGNHYIVK